VLEVSLAFFDSPEVVSEYFEWAFHKSKS